MRNLREARWTPEVKKVYRVYPAAIRSKLWPDIVKLAGQGKIEDAKALAATQEKRSLSVRAENVIARRLRVLSPEKFALRMETSNRLKGLFRTMSGKVSDVVWTKASGIGSIKKVSDGIHVAVVELRRSMTTLITDTVWQAVLMGVRHMGEAAKPVFRDNQESFETELIAISEFENPVLQMVLLEAGARTSVSAKLPGGARAKADLNSAKWKKIVDGIYQDVAKSSLRGLNMSERIWDLTNRAEQDLKRRVAADIAAGKSPREIADGITKDIFVQGVDDGFIGGAGVYKSPLKNADRLARTELSRAYTKAQTSWAQDKSWLEGLRVTLSDAHDKEDVCDQYAGDVYSPDEFESLVPFHPYCQCVGTFVIKQEYLTDPANNEDEG